MRPFNTEQDTRGANDGSFTKDGGIKIKNIHVNSEPAPKPKEHPPLEPILGPSRVLAWDQCAICHGGISAECDCMAQWNAGTWYGGMPITYGIDK